jgi:hypothetical protein
MNSLRYQDKPLLRLLECFVLKAINELSVADAENLRLMQPKLAQIYGEQGSWDQIIAATMHFPENMPTLIREMWDRNQAIAKQQNATLSPQQFAEMFVDQNLV